MTRAAHVRILLAVLATLLGAGCGPSGGGDERAPAAREITRENFVEAGEYVVHFNALATEMLPAEVARAYGIVRSDSRAMLNVSVIRKEPGTIGKSVGAEVKVNASNLTGQLKSVTLRKIDEGEAIYYIGEVPVANRETLIFDIQVTPEGEQDPVVVKFRQQFYTD
ncbi:MAG: DUF4426 domain-containing protein [Gammaproteobacteria bacterium]|jgi:hypothetical protein